VIAFRRQTELGWRLLEGGKRLAARIEAALVGEAAYGSVLRFQRDGPSANASWLVYYVRRAEWANPKRPPVPLSLIRQLVEPL
jgi:hypothetical protein